MYPNRETGWADGQPNENNERTDDLDGAAEGDNDTSRIGFPVNQTAPSRPRSRDSHYDRDRDMRGDRGEPEYYGNRSRNHGGTEPRRRRNDSYRGDRSRMDEYDFEYREREGRRTRHVPERERQYPEYEYTGGYSGGGGRSSRGAYGNHMTQRELAERSRIENPVGYRAWYEKYTAFQRNPKRAPHPGLPPLLYPGFPPTSMTPVGGYPYRQYPGGPPDHSFGELSVVDRQSVHSGRSSANELLSYPNYSNGPSFNQTPSINQDPHAGGFKPIDPHYHKTPEPDRMTPLKYNTSHCLGVLTPLGQLIKIKNEGSAVEIVQVKSLMSHLPEFKEVAAFPGPLVKGTTHKNTVIQFCQKKIKESQANVKLVDGQHFVLLWELLILLLKQNGIVVGSDVAELLLKNNNSTLEDISGNEESQSKDSGSEEEEHVEVNGGGINVQPINEAKATEKFCEYLLYGHKKDAVEYAMNNNLWGHALFLATKMDERTYGNVLARFANCTPFNHPIQTFYQLMSGRQPSSAKSCCDDTFGDWKPHLAMILSNAGSRPEVEYKAIVKMGDTLGNKNHIFAAQFCYLMGQMDFSAQSKLGPLLGLSLSAENINEATQMTEIYEFARSLAEPTFTLGPSFLNSKLSYTKTLIDLGFIEEAFAYCEEMVKKSKFFTSGNQTEDLTVLRWSILQIAERLVRIEESETGEDPAWILELRHELNSTMSGGSQMTDSDSLPERRDSVPENETIQPPEAPVGSYDYEPKNQVEYSDYGAHTNSVSATINPEPAGMPVDNPPTFNPSYYEQPPSNYTYDQQIPPQQTTAISNQLSMLDVGGYTNPPAEPYMYQPNQHIQAPSMNHVSQPPMSFGDQGASTMGSYQYNPNQIMQPGYTPDYPDNNNYIQQGGSYSLPPMNQQPQLSDGQHGHGPGATKKKSVRFEDDEKTEEFEDDDENEYLTKKIKEIALGGCDPVNDHFAFCHPLKSNVRKNYVGFGSKELKSSLKERNSAVLNYHSERKRVMSGTQQIGNERPPNCSEEIMEEIDRLAFSSPDPYHSHSELGYGGTYPIDEPLIVNSLRDKMTRPTSLGIKKTFPIDKHCCAENELCEDHDNFYNGSSNSSSITTTPSGYSPKSHNSNGSLTGAGPNSYYHGKGFDNSLPKYPPQPPAPSNKEDSKNKKEKTGSKGGGDANKKQSSWSLSKIFGFKGPNQMILPDDKDPPIVWDDNTKKWVNKTGDEGDDSGPKGPPPKDSDLNGGMPPPPMMSMHSHPQGVGPPLMSQPMPNNQSNMPAQSNMPQKLQQQPFQNQNQSPYLDNMPMSAPNVPSNNHSVQQPQMNMGNSYGQQNTNTFVDGYQNSNQPYAAAAPSTNYSDPSMTGPNTSPNMNGLPTVAPTANNNKYKLPKNRNARPYVDVLNPSGTQPNSNPNNRISNGGVGGNMISPAGGAPGVPNMFIPSPISGSGDSGPVSFLTPAPPGPLPAQSQLETN